MKDLNGGVVPRYTTHDAIIILDRTAKGKVSGRSVRLCSEWMHSLRTSGASHGCSAPLHNPVKCAPEGHAYDRSGERIAQRENKQMTTIFRETRNGGTSIEESP